MHSIRKLFPELELSCWHLIEHITHQLGGKLIEWMEANGLTSYAAQTVFWREDTHKRRPKAKTPQATTIVTDNYWQQISRWHFWRLTTAKTSRRCQSKGDSVVNQIRVEIKETTKVGQEHRSLKKNSAGATITKMFKEQGQHRQLTADATTYGNTESSPSSSSSSSSSHSSKSSWIRGVNIGGWLLMERFITPYMFALNSCHLNGEFCFYPGQISAPPTTSPHHKVRMCVEIIGIVGLMQ